MNEIYLYDNSKTSCAKINVLMAFPGIYSFGMSSIGFLSVFKDLDTIEGVYAERLFTDSKTTVVHAKDVDVIGFSMSFELDFLSILKILDKYHIPFKAEDRGEEYPLIYGGGPVLSTNPEPYSQFFDFISVGDGENAIKPMFEMIRDNCNLTKKEILEKLNDTFDFVYVPRFKDRNKIVKKNTVKLRECVATPILTPDSFFKNTYIVEVERGCPKKCNFCQTCALNNPMRILDYDKIICSIEKGLKYTNKIALLGAAVCSHPKIDDICDYILKKREEQEIELSMSSLRADYISSKTVETLVKCGQNSTTIAIEAGSERLRKFINKDLKDEEIFSAVDTIVQNGLKSLKIYNMIGLPTEEQSDIDATVELAKKIKEKYKTLDLTMSFSTFIPKPHTMFEDYKQENIKSLEKKYQYLQKELTKSGVKIRCSSPKWDYWQAILSKGDDTLCDFLIEVFQTGGNLGAFKSAWKNFQKNYPQNQALLDNKKTIVNNQKVWDFIKLYK